MVTRAAMAVYIACTGFRSGSGTKFETDRKTDTWKSKI